MTEKEMERLNELSIIIADSSLCKLELTKEFLILLGKAAREIKTSAESEEKLMLHNVTVKHEENKVLESYYVMRGIVECDLNKKVISEQGLDHNPTPQEIAQFLYDSEADFVSVVQNYRFESELPF